MANPTGPNDLGANAWLVDEQYELFKNDRNQVAKSWWPILERYEAQLKNEQAKGAVATPPAPSPAAGGSSEPKPEQQKLQEKATSETPKAEVPLAAKTTKTPARPTPVPADAQPKPKAAETEEDSSEPIRKQLKGMPKSLAANMEQSLSVPTATSVRTIPAKLMIDNRIVINNHLKRTRGGKISFTHLIGYALIKALKQFPSQNVSYEVVDGKPTLVQHKDVNLGIAIDLPKPDGSRALLVPSIKKTQNMDFQEYLAAYEDLIKRTRGNKLGAADFAGTTVSLTNPGGIGTVHSVPRLMQGQGCIIGAGALDYSAEFMGSSPETPRRSRHRQDDHPHLHL